MNNEELTKLSFRVAFGAVRHFGRNLYTSNPPAIAELVANAWDAYATKCIIINHEDDLLIIDNGIGMTNEELTHRYALSGVNKDNNIRVPVDEEIRPYMGKKGIGKFAAFSLSDEYYLYTRSEQDKHWKKIVMKYEMMNVEDATVEVPVEQIDDLSELERQFLTEIKDIRGTILHIPNLKRKFIKSTKESLAKILSRRFSVNIAQKYEFSLIINDIEVDLKKHFYYDSMQLIRYFGYTLEDMKEKFPNLDEKYLIEENDDMLSSNSVKGWIGSTKGTSDLKIDNELNSAGVIVYINGKLADEDILKKYQNPTISNNYIIGEVDADFLQTEECDPVLSSREGLNYEIDSVLNLSEILDNIRRRIVNEWNEMRSNRTVEEQAYLNKMLQNSKYKSLYENLDDNEKRLFNKYSQKLFDKPAGDDVDESILNTYCPIIFSIVNTDAIKEMRMDSNDEMDETLCKLYNLFEKVEINNALRLKSNLQNRLDVIGKLQADIDQEAIEKVFERHLAVNPWLINPFWDVKARQIGTQEKLERILDSNKKEDTKIGYIDIIVEVADIRYPVIIEIKREKKTSYSAPNKTIILEQINSYRDAIMKQKYNDESDSVNIPAYFICGTKAMNQISQSDKDNLQNTNKIQLLTYEQIIENTKAMYYEALHSED